MLEIILDWILFLFPALWLVVINRVAKQCRLAFSYLTNEMNIPKPVIMVCLIRFRFGGEGKNSLSGDSLKSVSYMLVSWNKNRNVLFSNIWLIENAIKWANNFYKINYANILIHYDTVIRVTSRIYIYIYKIAWHYS